jgi:hypothetical protein
VNDDCLPDMLERIQKCKYCGREMDVRPLSFAENPFCAVCLKERCASAVSDMTPIEWIGTGEFVAFRRARRILQ